ncbi:MAG TPA: hypothetical protein VGI73_10465 [Solirubrobacterales bacterium]
MLVALNIVLVVVGLATGSGRSLYWVYLIILAAFTFGIDFLLLKGFRVIWWFLTLGGGGGTRHRNRRRQPMASPPDAADLPGLAPGAPTRRYVFPPKTAPVLPPPPDTWDSADHPDADRPPGWYFDPDDATRMRYWDSTLGGWQSKVIGAPRRLR